MKIHFVGDLGVSMQALKALASARGHTVTGSDIVTGHSPDNVKDCDLVVYTSAVPSDNCELRAARRRGIPTVERATYLAEISRFFSKTVAISGCHGKSTTTAMTGAALGALMPTVHVGVAGCSVVGSEKLFITEACEYNRSFLKLSPDIGVVLNVGFDHPDCYKDEADITSAYAEFCEHCRLRIVNGDDERCKDLKTDVSFGLKKHNHYRADNIRTEKALSSFDLIINGRRRARVNLSTFGAHSVMNALAALAVADQVKPSELSRAVAAIEKFSSVPRRFERLGIIGGKTVLSDYAHHPDEIKAAVSTAKEIFPSVAVVFQPHTYTRTAALKAEFAAALLLADTVILMPVYAAREKPFQGEDSDAIAAIMESTGKPVTLAPDFSSVTKMLTTLSEKAVIFMGAGDIDKYIRDFISSETPL